MVWYNGGSPLDEAVQRHNENTPRQEPIRGHTEKEPPCSPPQMQPRDPLSALLRDKDMLLLTAAILILMHEKADKKLILALAFVLFS